MKKLLILLLLGMLVAAGLALYTRREWHAVGNPAEGGFVEIPHGLGAREVVRLLEEKNVSTDRYSAFAYLFYKGARHKLQAGEYQFDRPLTMKEVLDKIISGAVYLHKFSVPEGLT